MMDFIPEAQTLLMVVAGVLRVKPKKKKEKKKLTGLSGVMVLCVILEKVSCTALYFTMLKPFSVFLFPFISFVCNSLI